MSLIYVSGRPYAPEWFSLQGFGYEVFDWKQTEEALRWLSGLSVKRARSFRIVPMWDDAFHFVYADQPFSLGLARAFIKMSE